MIKKIYHKVTDNSYLFSVIANILGVVLGFVFSILYSRYMGAELRGTGAIVMNYGSLSSLFLCLGIYQAYPYFKKTKSQDLFNSFIDKIFGLMLVYLVIAIVISFIPNISLNIKIAGYISTLAMAIKQLNYIVLIENPRLRNMASIWLNLIDIGIILILILTTKANIFICYGFLIVKETVYFIIAISNLKIKLISIRPTLNGIIPYIRYGIVPMLTIILMNINYNIDILIQQWLGITNVQIGIYSLGLSLANKVWLIPDALKDILLSKIVKGKGKIEVAKITRISFWISIIIVIGFVPLGRQLIILLYGHEFAGAYLVTILIFAGTIGMVFYKMVYSFNVAHGHKNINFIFLLTAAVINVLLNIILVPIIGILGSAISSLVSYLVCGLAFLIYFCRFTSTNIFDMILLKKEDIEAIKRLVKKERV